MLVRAAAVRCIALCSFAAAAAAQDDAPWLLASRVDVTGSTTFSSAAIRDQLARSLRVADGLLRAKDAAEREQVIVECTLDGHRRAGFVDATVRAERRDDGRLLLHVDEGPRCRYGEVRVTGNHALTTAELVAAIQRPAERWSGWSGEGFANCSSTVLTGLKQRVVSAYADVARHGAAVDVAFVRVDDRVDLVVTVNNDEGRVARVGKIRLDGERPDDVAAVLARIQPAEDTPLTAALALSLRTQVEDLGRYIGVRITSYPSDPASTSLGMQVKVASFAPAMAEMPWRDLDQLRAGLATVRTHLDASRLVQVPIRLDAEVSRLGFTLLPGWLVLMIGKDGLGVRCDRVRLPDGTTGPLEFLVGSTCAFVGLGDGSCGFVEFDGVAAEVSLAWTTLDSGEFEMRWGLGFHASDTPSASPFLFWIHPATALRLLQRDHVTRDGDDLVVNIPDAPVRIDRAGAVRPAAKEGVPAMALLPVTFAEAVAAARKRFDAAHAYGLVEYLVQFGAANASVAQAATKPARTGALLLSCRDWLRARAPAAPKPSDERFVVPANTPSAGFADVIAPMLFAAASGTPEHSWVAQLVRPSRALLLHLGSGVKAVSDVAAAETSGPLATAAAALLLETAGYDDLAKKCWKRALDRCTTEAAVADLQALVAADAPPAWLADLAAHLRNDPRNEAVFADLPRDAKATAVLARAFAHCWDAGLGDAVREWLQERG